MKYNKKQFNILSKHFSIYNDSKYMELHYWTNGGVNMVIYISHTSNDSLVKQFYHYIAFFDVDAEIDILRQDSRYRTAFRISDSLKDLNEYVKDMKSVLKELRDSE